MADAQFILPIALASKTDAGRLLREVTAVNEFLEQAAIRQPGTALVLPKTSRLMTEITELNKLNMLRTEDRTRLLEFLNNLFEHAPQLHMSFSAEPNTAFMQKLTSYIRQNIHPHALIQVGLQPTIGAGFMLRTTNKYYDFSLRTALKTKHEILMHNIQAFQAPEQPNNVSNEIPA